ncbi:MAG TPA: hypothetical protein VLQ90_12885 [Pyrinomonadaceae bacterium]|nr:hypothetical protein [Pyrinomonadaceae bacterium]
MKTPVAFFIFNRPDPTARVFAEIARARPARLLVVADGPRADRVGEREAVWLPDQSLTGLTGLAKSAPISRRVTWAANSACPVA